MWIDNILGEATTRIDNRIRIILFCQHTKYRNSNVYKKDIITYTGLYADMEAPTKTISGRYHRATRKINYTDHK